ncbi:c-type cytochrome [Mesorhizobium sp. M7A.F.Ca.MR.176.00.0.0]|uniref:c-type cytochrome n=1 Tax=Mesorhizobium sp. M7A.F.Ca.MR.176.00.0.0 TaxID=2496776 RepID=UPI0013E3D45D|nr:c-type cytochrome [Mesorhizobium sp. M7A.F.Ca.MR.176.00.0.0]
MKTTSLPAAPPASGNITSDKIAGVGGWGNEELSRFLKTGVVPGKAYAGGPMAETVMNSLQHLSDDDIQAIVAYLRDVPAQPGDEKQPRFTWGNAAAAAADGDAGTEGMTQGSGTATGDDLYRSLFSTCHGANGGGSSDGSYRSLTSNSTPGAATPEDVVMTILEGVKAGDVAGRQSMAAFGGWLDDGQVAALANYVTARFGNPDLSVTAADVRQMRAGTTTSQTIIILAVQSLVAGAAVLMLACCFCWQDACAVGRLKRASCSRIEIGGNVARLLRRQICIGHGRLRVNVPRPADPAHHRIRGGSRRPGISSFDDALQGRTDGATGAGHSRDFVTSATAVADHCRDGPVRVAPDGLCNGGFPEIVAADQVDGANHRNNDDRRGYACHPRQRGWHQPDGLSAHPRLLPPQDAAR